MGRVQPADVPDSARLTQYGEKPPQGQGFRDKLRREIGETELSLIWGELDSQAASIMVTGISHFWADSRVTTAGRLRACDFQVVHSPTRGNSLHVSVYPPGQAGADWAEWDDAMAERFNQCFTEQDVDGGELDG